MGNNGMQDKWIEQAREKYRVENVRTYGTWYSNQSVMNAWWSGAEWVLRESPHVQALVTRLRETNKLVSDDVIRLMNVRALELFENACKETG
jgi:hypothetical protein